MKSRLLAMLLAGVVTLSACSDSPVSQRIEEAPTAALVPEGTGGIEPLRPPHRTVDPNYSLNRRLVKNPGTIHNEILAAFERRWSFRNAPPLTEVDYRRIMVAAANEVLAAHGVPERITEDDLTFLAHQAHRVAWASGFDMASPPPDAGLRLLDFMQRTGRISPGEREALASYLSQLADGAADGSLPIIAGGEAESPVVRDYRRVAASSREFWSAARPREMPIQNSWEDVARWLFEFAIDAGYTAVLGGGWVGTIVGAYMSGVVNVVFSMAPPDGGVGDPDGCCGACWVCICYYCAGGGPLN